jgi:hypothetical protein
MTPSSATTNHSSTLGPVLWGFCIASGLFLLAIGIGFIFFPVLLTQNFGIPLTDAASDPYLSIAGIRDLFAGSLILVFALLRDRRALGFIILGGAIVPVGDGLVVLLHSPRPLEFLPLHWGPAAALFVLAFFLLRPPPPKQLP